jgi:2-dehydropantoate 2-reductase
MTLVLLFDSGPCMMKVAVMGSGGVGGYFGARLAAAGNDVTFVARGAHLEAMQKHGLRLDSEIGKLHLERVKAVADAGDVPEADAIIFAVKMRDTESAADSLRPLVAKGAAIFTFQNGVESGTRIGRIVGAGKVVEGAARIAAHISEPGVVRQIGNFAILEFGEADGKPSARTQAFHAACVAAGIDATLTANISRTIWAKFALLAPMSGMTALTRGPIGPVRANANSRALLQAAVEETVALGVALKTGLVPEDAARTMKVIDSLPGEMMASMAHDLMAGKPIELEGLSGAVARLADENGVSAPTHAFIAAALAPFVDGKPQA